MDINHNFLAVGIVGFVAVVGLLMFGLGISTSDNDVTGSVVSLNRDFLSLKQQCIYTQACGRINGNVISFPSEVPVVFGATSLIFEGARADGSADFVWVDTTNIQDLPNGDKQWTLSEHGSSNLRLCNQIFTGFQEFPWSEPNQVSLKLVGFNADKSIALVEVRM